MGTTTGGDVAICGGFYAAYFSPECYRYQSDTDQWAHMADMAEGRSYYGEVQLNSQDFWITGQSTRKKMGLFYSKQFET